MSDDLSETQVAAILNEAVALSAREFAIAEQLVHGLVVDLEADRLPDEFELP